MEGFEKEWNYTDASRRYVTYTNLDPGEYTFRIKASNNDDVWNEKGVSLRIIILPPWWKTLLFRLMIAFLVIFLFVSVFLIRVRQLNKQKMLLEKSIAMKTYELQLKNETLTRQTDELGKSNKLLEEKQLKIEKQTEELLTQQEVLVNLNNELNELNTSKDKFFSIIAHDLKNPFTTLIGYSSLLKEDIELGDLRKIEESVDFINTSAVQTLRLLENLLEWANSQRGKISFMPESIKLSRLLREEIFIVDDMAKGKNIELKSYIPDTLTIVADKNMIRTIFRNLITNAVKFTHKNGKVEVNAIINDNQLEVAVSDNGIGMTNETAAKLFRIDANLSTRGTENEKGTGLGLFLCKEFIEKHYGTIWVESEIGKGSTFKFIIPLDVTQIGHVI
jgi:signal transduction histidine kinase